MSTHRNSKPPMPNNDDRRQLGQTRPHAFHSRNPAGSKLLRRFATSRRAS